MKYHAKDGSRGGGRGARRGRDDGHSLGDFLDELSSPKPDYKVRALCKLAARTLAGTLAGECGDAVLQDLFVVAVDPAPHAGRLMVTLQVGVTAAAVGAPEIYQRLEAVKGMLRTRVAEAAVRKRAPDLAFLVLGRGELREEVRHGDGA